MAEKGVLTVISGFSGAGKGTLMRELIHKYPYFLSVSATTRKPRVGEVDKVDYYFHTREEFEQMIEKNELIEWAEYVGNYYGTPRKAVEQQLYDGKDVILEIETQGGMLVKEQFPDAILIFVTPPTAEELKRRLINRGTETEEQIEKRLAQAAKEATYMKDYDYIVVNDFVDRTVEQIHTLITNEHYLTVRCKDMIQSLQEELKQFANGDE